ncbi:MAG: putative 2-dehydropantoate 2-reductase [Bacteroidales bacterium]|jgi:2-dehydropantoate 2-reductase|nr:putative 2-dehydropantoate 2-reductase [Bacteroidales bacterium]
MKKIKYAVIGTGALGGYYGAKLVHGGCDVNFLLHSDYKYVKENGLRVDSVSGNFVLPHVNAYSSTSQMPAADVILVCMKTTNNHLLKDMLYPILQKGTVIILIQNGLGIEEALSEEIPEAGIARGLAFICAEKTGPGHISHFDYGKLILASFNLDRTDVLKNVCDDFSNAGIPCVFSDDLNLSRWQKLVWNCTFNGLAVVLDSKTDVILANDKTRALALDIMKEVIAGAKACGVDLNEDFADSIMEMTLHMRPYAPSMKVDFDHKRPLEINAIYTQPVLFAARNGFAMKKTEMLEQMLHFIDERNRNK